MVGSSGFGISASELITEFITLLFSKLAMELTNRFNSTSQCGFGLVQFFSPIELHQYLDEHPLRSSTQTALK